MFVFHIVKGPHIWLRSHPPLFHNFKQFNIKDAAADFPIIQKEVDELLAKGAIEPSTGSAGLYSNVYVGPKHKGVLQPFPVLSDSVASYMYLLLGCLLSDRYGNLLNKVNSLSLLISRVFICMFLLLSVIVIF